ncbi:MULTISPECIES: hypothetical protein [unclassified Paenibacillus]|uniref:hypothetical protein n=1 Tax=unclassified Paenibacillus TaxID=185978 RepID=UPI00240612F5|nr:MULTISPECIES: hypothetical protein [unclassified Paenibacillus]MDF9845194.1 hypothetical protein [Paenibacillus sp. PastF-2]MDF9850314.1 hypothetical protein [Paenibacillus sp. PastM-2]MDF9856983.1 hypothetical protein [Paenibacillus sp. PastF-1]MDH6482160.1 hypothetical protein [Paenibacillus sp. PastH-2]MDH6509676.1 hypothetical protein [Paenibacillus sp. PastM-3]
MTKEKKYASNYWDEEKGEVIEFGNNFMRCYDKAGKLQFGSKYTNKAGETVYQVKFVIDRKELFDDDQAADYLRATINDWEEMLEGE